MHEDIIKLGVEITTSEKIIAPEKSGVGFEIKSDRIDNLTVRKSKIE